LGKKDGRMAWMGRARRAALVGVVAFVVAGARGQGGVDESLGGRGRGVVVGINADFPPYEYVNEKGEASGFDVEMARAVGEVMRLAIEFRAGEWRAMRGALERGEIDMLAGMLFSEERAERVSFSHRYKVVQYSAFVRVGGPRIDGIEDMLRLRVIVESGSLMHDVLRSRGMGPTLVLVSSEPEALRLLASGEFDCAVAPMLTGKMEIKRPRLENIEPAGGAIASLDLCFAVAKGREALLGDLDAGLEIVARTGARDVIYDRWFGVLEPRGSTIEEVIRISLWVVGPMAGLLGVALVWTRSLRKQVRLRTGQLGAELAERKLAEAALRESERRFTQLAESISDVFWFAGWNPAEIKYVSPSFERIWGLPRSALYADPLIWQRSIHPDDREGVASKFQSFVRDTGKGLYEAEFRVIHTDGSVRWVSDRGAAIEVREGVVRQIAGIASDITRRKEDEARQSLMMQELDHRVKNNLASVLSIAETTIAGSRSLGEFGESFRGRILAMARSHVALAESRWRGASLRGLIGQTALPYQDQSGASVEMIGTDLEVAPGAAAAVSMTLNELCTNAAKHGALSRSGGRVRIEWRRVKGGEGELGETFPSGEVLKGKLEGVVADKHDEGEMVEIIWSESGGPEGSEPIREGMGTRLMKGLVGHELRGKIHFDYGAGGMVCTISFPLRGEAAQGGEG